MPTIAEIIREATLKARSDWLIYTLEQERAIYSLLDDAANAIIRDIEKFTIAGKVPPHRLTALYNKVTEEMRIMRPRLSGTIKIGMKNSVDYGIMTGIKSIEDILPAKYKLGVGTSWIDKAGKIHKWNAMEEFYNDSMWAQMNRDVMNVLFKYRQAEITLSSFIWDISFETQKAIKYAIQMSVLQGRSAAELSRSIRQLTIGTETRPILKAGRLFRRQWKNGKLVLSEPAKIYRPGKGVYRSAYKNAMRLARTQLAFAYSEGTIRYAQRKDWIDGVTYRTGSGNPCPICASLDGQFFKKGEEPIIPTHPNCMCYWELHIQEGKA